MKIFVDFESTGINPYQSEALTAFFLREDGEAYEFKSKVRTWSEEAAEIHGITESEMHTYPNKDYAWEQLLEWLPSEFEMIVYANYNTQLGYLLFDVVLFKMELMDYLNIDHECKIPIKLTSFSVHSLAKECARLNLFKPFRNPETNRVSFKQESVYKALFDESYDTHNAKADVAAMVRIYRLLMSLKTTNKSMVEKDQLSLL